MHDTRHHGRDYGTTLVPNVRGMEGEEKGRTQTEEVHMSRKNRLNHAPPRESRQKRQDNNWKKGDPKEKNGGKGGCPHEGFQGGPM